MTSLQDSPAESPSPSGTNTPQRPAGTHDNVYDRSQSIASDLRKQPSKSIPSKAGATLKYDSDSDIDPDELLPVYLKIRAQLFHLQLPKQAVNQPTGHRKRDRQAVPRDVTDKPSTDLKAAKLQRKLDRIAGDVLFDKYVADQQWEGQRVQLERDAAAQRNAASGQAPERVPHPAEVLEDSDSGEVSKEASRMAVEVLEDGNSDDDAAVAELFASLPVTEVDPVTGKSSVVVNSSDGTKVTVRDFGKITGISPRRVLEEACKAR